MSKTEGEKGGFEVDRPEVGRLFKAIESFVELKDVVLARIFGRVERSRGLLT